jgi:flagellar basal-body rod protein FlgF
MLYLAMNGAKHLLLQQASTAHNLANVSTPGFRAELNAFRALPVVGGGMPTRTLVVDSTTGSDFTAGAMQYTGRSLDVAVRDKGLFAVQSANGEAYTRNGGFDVDANGQLKTRNGLPVLGEGGPITVPTDGQIIIAEDGTVSSLPNGQTVGATEVGKLKLVNPPERDLVRGEDGLFRLANNQPAAADPQVQVFAGTLESSNVSPTEALVTMISNARQYETQIKLIQTAEQNSRQAAQILNIGS